MQIKLPRYTSAPASGPVFRYACQKLTVDYDYEESAGIVVWIRLEFNGVEAVKYVEQENGDVGDVGEFDHLTRWSSSPWLDEIIGNWKRHFPHMNRDDIAPSFHYLLYCDHAGSLHVIARGVKIIENPELDELNTLPSYR